MTMNYRMPAEWERHKATLLAWPHNHADWPGKFAPIPWVYAEIIRHLTRHERVMLLVQNARAEASAKDMLERAGADLGKVDFFQIPTNRVWMRDAGPIWVKPSTILDFRFNAWAKYPNHRLDDAIPKKLGALLSLRANAESAAIQKSSKNRIASSHAPRNDVRIIQPVHKGKRVVLEGGAIDVNGKGLLLSTEECLLSKKQCRNPGFTAADYEEIFAKYLGISKVIWLDKGIVGDDTHGHVDDIARFVNEDTVVTVVEGNKKDANYALLQENLKRLKKTKLTIVELPMPKPVIFEGERLPASYANFLIANKQVLVPVFNDANDRIALNILAECFPGREIIPIYCGDFIWGLGTIHCASQQMPA
ncbi:MAG: agmatine deiminase family protein [Alphaproteobacteria bacterium]|nr:agmatine deiminase family protein [Alphaproteobacteria bacterium]